MRETDFNVGKFFAFLFVFILFLFMLSPLFENGEGAKLDKSLNNLKNRVSYFHSFKSVKESERILSKNNDFSKYREITDSAKTVIFGESKDLENGTANLVTSIVLDYRGFDTLGELIVLFISILGLTIILSGLSFSKFEEPSFLQITGVKFITPFMLLVGIYIFLHGHLSPGGGFPAGVIIATATLFSLIGYKFNFAISNLKLIESNSGFLITLLTTLGLYFTGSFFGNYLPTGIIGKLYSSLLILIIYSLIGLKVGAELSTGLKTLYNGEKDDDR
ncbi:MAG: MnhB domain-containing protein [bacterium]|uniref:Multisubunit Na+/H+ antiporter, MnhB subunit n=2 Tax=Bacteria candidate phyla TaxID=1783234 RepID=A0A101I1C6_UNCT6|nr:MAG: Multisubunit Na+/H+ antiporter, MnhB subunit [candidate division TA06 bacterium 32_111]KUK86594.1 MAG: Multisubunit Na+/H+ antiporter, MnhB subunit [candidate division TA06 bacterium 34_109]MDI6701243.1 MnhB domain-containing protein [bacterium]HAF07866.1 cation:proton antiporter [candidate division WOR-3 bacterium]HCP17384.1 cation:proton antiporter [candidate division WOR-3 bacterium]